MTMKYFFVFLLLPFGIAAQADKTTRDNSEPVVAAPSAARDSASIYSVVDEPAEYIGGMLAMKDFLAANLKLPETFQQQDVAGKCYLKFVVEPDGRLTNIKVHRGVVDCPECDAEAVRVVGIMPKWKPGTLKGKVVRSYFVLPIKFEV